jgi:hypothetical protein
VACKIAEALDKGVKTIANVKNKRPITSKMIHNKIGRDIIFG